MKIIFAGGGTGGHVAPAVALAEEINRRDGINEILFVGRAGGNENKMIKNAGFDLEELRIYGIERRLTGRNIKNLIAALKAMSRSKQIIKDFAPDAIVGTGGYVCWPIIKAGQKLNIPTYIHESNVFPGLATKSLSAKCRRVFLGHEKTAEYLPKTVATKTTGNPIRKDFSTISRSYARAKLGLREKNVFIVSFGGSGGSALLNDHLISLMRNFSAKNDKIVHIHATGAKYYEKYKSEIKNIRDAGCKILPYIDDMPLYLKAADIVICRCGAMTLSEIASASCASILIPSPNVTNDHQRKNGELLASANAAIMIEEKDLTEESLASALKRLYKNPQERQKLSKCIEKFAICDAQKTIINDIFSDISR